MLARRLASQQIIRPAFSKARDLVAWLGATQAQDYAGARWALALRLRGAMTEAAIERAIAEGTILRAHALRGTWQFVVPEDLRWMISLGAARVRARAGSRHRQLGLDAGTLRRSHGVLARALRDGPRTRDELATALQGAGITTGTERLIHILGDAELEGLICGGPRRGKQFTYVLVDAVTPRAAGRLDRADALAELAGRYFRSRGPATVQDFAWWSGLSASDAREGLSAIHSTLVSEIVDGHTYWRAAEAAPVAAPPPAVLLPPFDEYMIGYTDRDAMLDARHTKRVNAGGGMLNPLVVVRGRVVGTWRRTLARSTVSIEIDLFRLLNRVEWRAVGAAAERYAGFLELELSPALSRTKIMM